MTLKEWLYWHRPMITTRNKRAIELDIFNNIIKKANYSAINPVLQDLESLRNDTWNQDKITFIQSWLKSNFCVDKDN